MFGSTVAVVVSLALFTWAWAWNNHMQDSKLVGYVCVTIAALGSVVLYASEAAMKLAGYAVTLLNGIGEGIGVGAAAPVVLGIVCIATFGLTVYDLWHNPEHNPGAVTALVIAPIAAHGTLGPMHTTMEVIYGGLSLGTLSGLQGFFGG